MFSKNVKQTFETELPVLTELTARALVDKGVVGIPCAKTKTQLLKVILKVTVAQSLKKCIFI